VLIATWSKVSGPGNVTFTNPNLASTTATFSAAGTYILRLTANDSQSSSFSDAMVTVNSGAVTAITQVSPNSGQQGQGGPLTVVGQNTHFVQGTTQLDMGPGITVNSVTVSCPTCLTAQVTVADNAPIGPHDVTVTTGTEIAKLAGGFIVQPGTPIITSFGPTSILQGQQNMALTVTAKFTHFAQGITQVSLGSGVTINSVTVSSPTDLTAQISADPTASVGPRTLTVTTGTEVVFVINAFTVKVGTSVLLSLTPNAGAPGQQNLPITMSGQLTNWVQGTSSANFGTGITVQSLTVSSATSATAVVSIDPAATLGSRTVTVTTGAEVDSLLNGFTVNGPFISTVDPGGSSQGATNLPVQITGTNTHFVQGTSVASFGAGITVLSTTVDSARPFPLADYSWRRMCNCA
jgi:hypothetical protein